MIGGSSWVDSVCLVACSRDASCREALREKSFEFHHGGSQLGAVALTDHTQIEVPSSPTKSNGGRLMQGDAAQSYNHESMLTGSPLTRKCLFLFSFLLKKGILRDVFIQKAVVAWNNAPGNTVKVPISQEYTGFSSSKTAPLLRQ